MTSESVQPTGMRPHYWKGELPIAFVFSVPGARENSTGRPVSGPTGENLSFALDFLHYELPEVFSSTDRYAYRFTNAYSKPIAKSLGDVSSQASDKQVQAPENIARVLSDISGCSVVILCGLKAQLLAESIRQDSKTIVCAWHTSNQALSSKYCSVEVARLPEPYARRQVRAKLWAQEVLNSLRTSSHVA